MPSRCACGCGVQVSQGGCFKEGCQPDGTSRDPRGKIKAASKIGSASAAQAIRNAKHNAKAQERVCEENEKRIANMAKDEDIISKAEAYLLVYNMVTLPQIRLGG